jgi:PDZ domain-containing protein
MRQMRAWQAVSLAIAAGAIGYFLGSVRPDPEPSSLAAERDSAVQRAERAETELAALRDTRRPSRVAGSQPAGAIAPDTRAPHDPESAAAPRPKETAAKSTPESRRARVNEIRAALHLVFEKHEGEKAIAFLKELAALAPEGRDDAMKLALDINADVEGAGDLRLPQQQFYTGLGDPAIRDLMAWSLGNEASSPADFRVLSAWSLPWVLGPDETVALFDATLSHENDRAVQSAIVANLGQINSAKAEAALAAVLADATRDAALRGDAAVALSTSRDPTVQQTLDAAVADGNPRIAAAQKVSAVFRDPPASGCLVATTSPDGLADTSGMRPGDVITAYNGRAVLTESDLRREVKGVTGTEPVPVAIVRDGQPQTLQVKPGRLDRGVLLKPVTKK